MSHPIFGEVIHAYTRIQAISDGELVDVSKAAQGVGMKFPVAVTRSVWNMIETPDDVKAKWHQDTAGRLHDVVWMMRCAIPRSKQTDRIVFRLFLATEAKGKPQDERHLKTFQAVVGPGDNAEPVITIMQMDED